MALTQERALRAAQGPGAYDEDSDLLWPARPGFKIMSGGDQRSAYLSRCSRAPGLYMPGTAYSHGHPCTSCVIGKLWRA